MDELNKKVNQGETNKDEKIQITDDEAEKVAGGANFRFFDVEKRKPKGNPKGNSSNNG